MYCNTNYALLALIVEKVTTHPGSFGDAENRFQPLGMGTIYFFSKRFTADCNLFTIRKQISYPTDRIRWNLWGQNCYTNAKEDLFKFSKDYAENFLRKSLKGLFLHLRQ